jgi:hypothetical protein
MVAGSIIECRCRKKKEREGEKKKGVKAPLHPLTSLFFFGGVGGGQSRRVRKGGGGSGGTLLLVLFYPQPKRGSIVRGGVRERERRRWAKSLTHHPHLRDISQYICV